MTTRFDAAYIYSSDDGEIVMVGFADRQYDTQRYVLLQRAKNVSDEERALGQEQVHVTVDDQGRSMYGGIRAVLFDGNAVTIQLEEGCGRQLGTDEEIMIRLAVDDAQRAELLAGMKDLFAHRPVALVEIGAGTS